MISLNTWRLFKILYALILFWDGYLQIALLGASVLLLEFRVFIRFFRIFLSGFSGMAQNNLYQDVEREIAP